MAIIVVALVPVPAFSIPENASRIVPQAYKQAAIKYGVPPKILFAIALQESRKSIGNGIVRPWPWTLNIAGTPKRYNSAQKMLVDLAAVLSTGKTNVDVGIMQINMRWHRQRFRNLQDAVNPSLNLEVGAQILREEHSGCNKDWWCAVGRYHSRKKENSDKYIKSVKKHWSELL